jgi:hypothetical protein
MTEGKIWKKETKKLAQKRDNRIKSSGRTPFSQQVVLEV